MSSMTPHVRKLAQRSIDEYYNAYTFFSWPDSLPRDCYWMSPELLSPFGTEIFDNLSQDQRHTLSQAELCNFFSITIHGERDLLAGVVPLLEIDAADEISEYLHHFVKEENEHQWFFAKFCRTYFETILRPIGPPAPASPHPPDIAAFVTFAQILMFEEIGVFYNQKMAADERLPEIVREINRVHYIDESRHIAFGRLYVKELHRPLVDRYPEPQLRALHDYIEAYLWWIGESFFSPDVYKQAGLKGYATRQRLLGDEAVRARRSAAFERSRRLISQLRSTLAPPGAVAEVPESDPREPA
jgi:hypothetical protein